MSILENTGELEDTVENRQAACDAAYRLYESDECDVSENPADVDFADGGVWVQARVWVYNSELDGETTEARRDR